MTSDKYCPESKQPELKHAAVQVEKLEARSRLVALRRFEHAGAEHALMRRLRQHFARVTFATVGLYGRANPVVVFFAANEKSFNTELLASIDREFGLDDEKSIISFRDIKRGVEKRVLAVQGKVAALRLTGEALAWDWLKDALAKGVSVTDLRPWVLAATDAAPPAIRGGRVVCTCHGVEEGEIQESVYGGTDFESLKRELKCGTECGSCLLEVERICEAARPLEIKAAAGL